MMSIHDGDLTSTRKEKDVVEGSLSGSSSVKYSSLSMCSTEDDAPSSSSNGPLDNLSDLISQLPIM
ncbi:unnamed protein product [Arabis nemorensis]|uniref:Uncharacterized protein n=1 Tax=Arabis nemorensis TaxID=586526 RepID=A0A565CCA2_9BRAS|nr:unnamed protein product [Arabis nemorensis]